MEQVFIRIKCKRDVMTIISQPHITNHLFYLLKFFLPTYLLKKIQNQHKHQRVILQLTSTQSTLVQPSLLLAMEKHKEIH